MHPTTHEVDPIPIGDGLDDDDDEEEEDDDEKHQYRPGSLFSNCLEMSLHLAHKIDDDDDDDEKHQYRPGNLFSNCLGMSLHLAHKIADSVFLKEKQDVLLYGSMIPYELGKQP